MAKKFTFKKQKRETGLRSCGHPYPDTVIKLDKKEVGTIFAPNWKTKDNTWHISLMVKIPEKPGDWNWITFKKRFEEEKDARLFLNEQFEIILNKYDLFQEEPDTQ